MTWLGGFEPRRPPQMTCAAAQWFKLRGYVCVRSTMYMHPEPQQTRILKSVLYKSIGCRQVDANLTKFLTRSGSGWHWCQSAAGLLHPPPPFHGKKQYWICCHAGFQTWDALFGNQHWGPACADHRVGRFGRTTAGYKSGQVCVDWVAVHVATGDWEVEHRTRVGTRVWGLCSTRQTLSSSAD